MKTLKKISFGAFAFILGLTLVLTQSAFKGTTLKTIKRIPLTVYYHGTTFSQASVTNESNWSTTPNDGGCDEEPEVACQMTIDSQFISGGTLQQDADLQATEFDNDNYFVSGSDDPAAEYINRSL
ncbi:hypothetical protein [Pedobacter agri]|uniref:hypothetical protein n=1 Tax=Pedobacter agri TaxID=454586 RepID=UPI002931DD77|nr:hypothetical protein [Pedobacter agri]